MKLFVSSKELYTFVSKQPITVVKFFNENCAPCKALTPILDQLEEKFGDNVQWAEVNISVDGSEAAVMKYGVRNTPTVCVFKDNEQVARLVGANVGTPLQSLLIDLMNE